MAVAPTAIEPITSWKLSKLREELVSIARQYKAQRSGQLLARREMLHAELLRRRSSSKSRDERTYLLTFSIDKEVKAIIGDDR